MKTREYEAAQIEEVAAVIRAGGMVAIPTDTVFGLAISSADHRAIGNLKAAKGRPEDKPFPMMVATTKQLMEVAQVGERELKVIERFLPGALTIILRKRESLPDIITNGFPTVGIRMPDDEWVLRLIRLVGSPLLVPSANLSGHAPGRSDAEVLKQLSGRIDGIVRGKSGAKQASTIVDMSTEEIRIVRIGKISLEEVLAAI